MLFILVLMFSSTTVPNPSEWQSIQNIFGAASFFQVMEIDNNDMLVRSHFLHPRLFPVGLPPLQ